MRRDWTNAARLGPLRPLRLSAVSAALDLPGHVRAGSGIRRWGTRLVVVQDDVSALALVDGLAGAVASLPLPADAAGHRHFSAQRGNKAAKLDLESCVVLPNGRLMALGSGSTAARERLVVVDPDHRVRVVDGGALFAHLRARPDFSGSELNIEGAVVTGERLCLLQRGNGAATADHAPINAVGELDLGAFCRWLDGAGAAPTLCRVRRIDLGHLHGVPLSFTDATALPDGRIVFLAGAEDSPDTYQDGAVLGTRIGLLDEDCLVLADILETDGQPTRLKLEGIDLLSIHPDGTLELVVVADMDDPDIPAVIAALTWG